MVEQRNNEHGQPIGDPVNNWIAPAVPLAKVTHGNLCRLEPLEVEKHTADLYEAFGKDTGGRNWTYLFVGPFEDFDGFKAWIASIASWEDPLFYIVIDLATEKAIGMASYMRIDPNFGAIEVGNIHFSPLLQKTPLATETMYLMMKNVFDLGYRRYEWKCDALNAPSRSAAVRFGFTYEGIFRQAIMYKGRSRDTAWFAIIDKDWPAVRAAYEQWLAADNFEPNGEQKCSLRQLMSEATRAA